MLASIVLQSTRVVDYSWLAPCTWYLPQPIQNRAMVATFIWVVPSILSGTMQGIPVMRLAPNNRCRTLESAARTNRLWPLLLTMMGHPLTNRQGAVVAICIRWCLSLEAGSTPNGVSMRSPCAALTHQNTCISRSSWINDSIIKYFLELISYHPL